MPDNTPMSQPYIPPWLWLGVFITVEIAAAYGCLTALALARSALKSPAAPR